VRAKAPKVLPGSNSVSTQSEPISTSVSSTLTPARKETIWSCVNAEQNMPTAMHVPPIRIAPR